MLWFQYSSNLILPFDCYSEAYRYALTLSIPISDVQQIKVKPCRSDHFLTLLEQILHYTEQGHSLQNALLAQQTFRLPLAAQRAMIIIESQLSQGFSIGHALALVAPKKVIPLLSLMPEDSTEESKVAALQITKQSLITQQDLTGRLLKSLTYPFAVIQSALLLALANAWLTDASLLPLTCAWLTLSGLQILLYYWLNAGFAYPFIVRHCQSFRIHGYLTLLAALLDNGESLQRALVTLRDSASTQERTQLIMALLKLQCGDAAHNALPNTWFINASATLLANTPHTGDLNLALTVAADEWQHRSEKALSILYKICPVLGMLIASSFVAYTLVQLYAPLMEVGNVVY
ncbi:hypothetical protein [Marinomonas ostreistagni]|uniref:hypothetical protein n=1 Tax=Marinomonas ostreistagni TaxID=359209 RepID=UPI0019519846|nr:hypothetical protein [Marinomonas ostreistagni]MBM6550260.1 hypothetical protein [Marinomonas ostreistagni]